MCAVNLLFCKQLPVSVYFEHAIRTHRCVEAISNLEFDRDIFAKLYPAIIRLVHPYLDALAGDIVQDFYNSLAPNPVALGFEP